MNGLRTAVAQAKQVFIAGCAATSEFADVLALAAELTDHGGATIGTIDDLLATDEVCELLVILQRWPEEYSSRQVHAVLDRFPVSRLVVCCGPWCDSDGRTRSLWPAACRVRAESAGARVRHELAVIRGTSSPLPLTANRDEAYLFDFTIVDRRDDFVRERPLRIAIHSVDPSIVDWLRAALESAGHRVVTAAEQSADVRLYDVDPWTPTMAKSIDAMQNAVPMTPIIALVGYDRPHERESMRQAGTSAFLAKLAPLSELLRVIYDVVEDRQNNATSGLPTRKRETGNLRVVRCDL